MTIAFAEATDDYTVRLQRLSQQLFEFIRLHPGDSLVAYRADARLPMETNWLSVHSRSYSNSVLVRVSNWWDSCGTLAELVEEKASPTKIRQLLASMQNFRGIKDYRGTFLGQYLVQGFPTFGGVGRGQRNSAHV